MNGGNPSRPVVGHAHAAEASPRSAASRPRRPDGESRKNLTEDCLKLAANQIHELLRDFDPDAIKKGLSEKPETYLSLLRSLAGLSQGAFRFKQLRLEQTQRRAKARHGKVRRQGGLPAELRKQIERELKLL